MKVEDLKKANDYRVKMEALERLIKECESGSEISILLCGIKSDGYFLQLDEAYGTFRKLVMLAAKQKIEELTIKVAEL